MDEKAADFEVSLALRPQWQIFVTNYVSGKSGTEAAIEAGYSPKIAAKRAHKLLQIPAIKQEVDRARKHLRSVTDYTAERAMENFEAAAAFAVKTSNANALAKVREMQAKLAGLMVDRVDVSVTGKIDINKALAEANARVDRWHLANVQDVQPRYPAALPVPVPRGDDEERHDIFS